MTPRAPRTSFDRTANMLGALALRISDEMADAVIEASGQSETGGAALSALGHFLEGPQIDLLRRVLGLTSSGTVRLIDRLEDAGLVTRARGEDGRSTVVRLTAKGRRVAERVTAARAAVLDDALSGLASDQRGTLESLLGPMLVGMMRTPGAERWTCRLCDTQTCGRPTGDCPLGAAAEERYGLRGQHDPRRVAR